MNRYGRSAADRKDGSRNPDHPLGGAGGGSAAEQAAQLQSLDFQPAQGYYFGVPRSGPSGPATTSPRGKRHRVPHLGSAGRANWRRRRRERNAVTRLAGDPFAWTVPAPFGPPDAGSGAMTASTRRTLDALPHGFRAAVILVDLEDRSYLDAAETLGVPVGTVMSRLHRGRKLLAAKMGAREAA